MLLLVSIFGFISSYRLYDIELGAERYHLVYSRNENSSSIDGINLICEYKNLTDIEVVNSSLTLLPNRFLANCRQLKSLYLSNNAIMEISHDSFDNLLKVIVLDLSRNQLTTLLKDIFEPLTNLEILNLSGNRFEIIDSDLFSHNQRLHSLDISENNLKVIQPGLFRTTKHLFDLDLNENRNLNTTDFLYDNELSVQSLNVANCRFTLFFIPKNVKWLNAWGNQIRHITAHPNNTLQTLILDHNNLTHFPHLSPTANLHDLHIRYNNIENINFTELSHFKKLKVLTTDLNPNQNISYAEIMNILPSLNQLEIESPDLNIEQQKWMFNDFKLNKFDYLRINSEIYSVRLENLNKKGNNPSEIPLELRVDI